MIRNKKDLIEYLEKDKFALEKNYRRPKFFGDEIWKFQICLRKYEYYKNTKKNLFMYYYYKLKFHRMSIKLGYEIPPNTFGSGLRINHIGPIIVHRNVKIGQWCDVFNGVNIGLWKNQPPKIGNRVWIGPGAKIFGDVEIKDDIFIGANSVVCKNLESTGSYAGTPAKLVNNQIPDFLKNRSEKYEKQKHKDKKY